MEKKEQTHSKIFEIASKIPAGNMKDYSNASQNNQSKKNLSKRSDNRIQTLNDSSASSHDPVVPEFTESHAVICEEEKSATSE